MGVGAKERYKKPDIIHQVHGIWRTRLAMPKTKICLGRKVSPWTASLLMIVGAIEPDGDDTEELSMKAPMSVSKPADLG